MSARTFMNELIYWIAWRELLQLFGYHRDWQASRNLLHSFKIIRDCRKKRKGEVCSRIHLGQWRLCGASTIRYDRREYKSDCNILHTQLLITFEEPFSNAQILEASDRERPIAKMGVDVAFVTRVRVVWLGQSHWHDQILNNLKLPWPEILATPLEQSILQ